MARWISKLSLRLRTLFRRTRVEEELREEFRFHLDHQIREYVGQGLSEEEARCASVCDMGGVEQHKEDCRDARGLRLIESFWRDLCFGMRMMRRSPGFTATALITLALGIAANTAVFSIVDAVLVRPLPYRDPSRIVRIGHGPPRLSEPTLGWPIFSALHEKSSCFASVALYSLKASSLTAEGTTNDINVVSASPSLFQLLGVDAAQGRVFSEDESQPGKDSILLLSDKLWQRLFDRDQSILGRSMILDNKAYTVIGIMPRGSGFPEGSGEVWIPQGVPSNYSRRLALGRLRDGISIKQASAEISSLATSTGSPTVINAERTVVTVIPLHELMMKQVKPALLMFFGAVIIVLLIACANLANLMAARARVRGKEFAIRTALGASRLQLARQSLLECLLLSAMGGGMGLTLAHWVINFLIYSSPLKLRTEYAIGVDFRVFAFATAISTLTGAAIGFSIVLESSRANLMEVIHESRKRLKPGKGFPFGSGTIITVQVAIGMVLLLAGGLMVRSFITLLTVDLGYEPNNVLTVQVSFWKGNSPFENQRQKMQHISFWQQLLEALAKQRGIEAAGVGSLPLSTRIPGYIYPEGWPQDEPAPGCDQFVSPAYFSALRMSLLDGRLLTNDDSDQAPEKVAVINETLAKRYFPGVTPLGKTISSSVVAVGSGPPRRIIGVVADIRHSTTDPETLPHIYYSMYQQPKAPLPTTSGYLTIRTHRNTGSLVPMIRTQVLQLDNTVSLGEFKTMDERIWESMLTPRFYIILMGGFALSALFLVLLGVYGVVAYTVSRRSREIGIRIALGAADRDVVGLILWQSLLPVFLGIGAGVAGSFVFSRLMANLLYGIHPHDPATFLLMPLFLLLAAATASYLPARRATKVDPVLALKEE